MLLSKANNTMNTNNTRPFSSFRSHVLPVLFVQFSQYGSTVMHDNTVKVDNTNNTDNTITLITQVTRRIKKYNTLTSVFVSLQKLKIYDSNKRGETSTKFCLSEFLMTAVKYFTNSVNIVENSGKLLIMRQLKYPPIGQITPIYIFTSRFQNFCI